MTEALTVCHCDRRGWDNRVWGKSQKKSLSVPVVIDDPYKERAMMAIPSERLMITYVIDYPGTPIGTQRASYTVTPDVFLQRISKARTFGLDI